MEATSRGGSLGFRLPRTGRPPPLPSVSCSSIGAADWPRAKAPVVIVGHQPTLGHVASFLLAGEVQDWSVKKAGVWWLSSRERDGEEQTVLRAVISPDLA